MKNMNDNFIFLKDELPEKGKKLIVITKTGDTSYCTRCNCNDLNCIEWRCQITGGTLLIDVVKWKYEDINNTLN